MQRSVGQGQFAYANPPDSSASTFRPLTGRSGTTRGAITSDSASYDPTSNQRSAFEEYRYDALGRRVLMRARQEYGCAQNCQNVVRRTIWDGDQVLAEIQAPGATNTPAFQMESEVMMGQVNTGSLTLPAHLMDEAEVAPSDTLPQAQTYGGFHYGRVLYTHGPGIDAPLSLVRMAYSDSLWTAQLVVLHNDWRGQYDVGSYAGGSLNKPCRRVVRSSNFQTYGSDGQVSEYPKFSGPLNANWFHCIEVEWPAPHVWVTRETRNRSLLGPVGWMGTLIDGMRDLSGQMYMRNRYYDPASGRFTQEDPIGLAGGLNVYAFGYGDPVSYDDPYGLCAEAAGDSTPKRSSNTCTPEDARWQNVMAGDHVKSEGIGPLIFLLPGAPEAKGVEELGGALIGVTGKIGEAALRQLGGESQVFFRTSIGARFVDQVVNGVGHESKVGAASLTRFVSRQIAKDAELLRTGQLNEIVALFPEPSHGTHRAEPPAGNGTPTGRNSRCASLRRKRAELPSNCAAVHNALSGDVRA